jgi:hypothetical protein
MSLQHNKPQTGIGIKPDDKWALPLAHTCHMELHAYGSELMWWHKRGVPDPFALCIEYYAKFKQAMRTGP